MASVNEARPLKKSEATTTVRHVVISAALGLGARFLIFLARPEPFGWRLVTIGAWCSRAEAAIMRSEGSAGEVRAS